MPEIPTVWQIVLGRILILTVIFGWIMYLITTIVRNFLSLEALGFRYTMESILYIVLVTSLAFSALMYLVARQGALHRFQDHTRVPRAVLDRYFREEEADHSITVLIPSYVEETHVVRNTLWSAVLQEFPHKNVVLLIDDPPNPTDPARKELLEAARALPQEIQDTLDVPYRRARAAQNDFFNQYEEHDPMDAAALRNIIHHYDDVIEWLEDFAETSRLVDHMDDFFVNRVVLGLASELKLVRLALHASEAQADYPSFARMAELYQRLVWIFGCKISSFERKQYASLSQEANKAMNLNSYISLMGKTLVMETSTAGTELLEMPPENGGKVLFPDSTYLLTLDADSMLLREYCLRLVYLMEEEGNENIAVAQTPYSSYRGAPTRIERIAGATTDVQHILHQGMTHYDASFWVGANAVIRKRALNDIEETQNVSGYPISTFIQDRTVIEDTESSIDLGIYGWKIYNYPERLSYSATPPDFGSLVVQRRRWANGGLLILPKFRKQIRTRKRNSDYPSFFEKALRFNYMASLSWANIGLAFLLVYPFDNRLLSLWVFAIGVPYFFGMGLDLKESGHRFTDIFRIYGLNIILIAVNLAGVFKSIQQAFTGQKIEFARTPKVANRTAATPLFIIVPYMVVFFSFIIFWRDYTAENWGNAIFAAFNVVMTMWAIVSYIGIWNSIVDIILGAVNWIMVDKKKKKRKKPKKYAPVPATEVDWQSILYYGDRRMRRDVTRKNDLRRRRTR